MHKVNITNSLTQRESSPTHPWTFDYHKLKELTVLHCQQVQSTSFTHAILPHYKNISVTAICQL